MSLLLFILRRAVRHWHILLTLGLGVVLATALLASTPLLVDTAIEFGLRRTLLSAPPIDNHLRLTTHANLSETDYQELDAQIQRLIQSRFGDHLDRVVRSLGSNWMYPWVNAELAPDLRINLRIFDDVENHVELVAGGLPPTVPEPPSESGAAIPVFISEEMAQAYTLRTGDRLALSFQRTDDEPRVWIKVTGIVRPRNPQDPYWFGNFSPMMSQGTQRWTSQFGALIRDDAFFPTQASLFPKAATETVWQAMLNSNDIKSSDISYLRRQLAGLGEDLRTRPDRIVLQTGLDEILARYQSQAETIRAPLFILAAEVVLLALFYVTMVAALSVRDAEREFAVLRSRGASGWQILRIQLSEAGLISVTALLSGPLLGLLLVRALTWSGPLADVGQPEWTLNFTESAWLAAAIGAAACMLGLLFPIGPALRRSIVSHQQMTGRATRRPWWQRFYVDVFVLLVGLALLWRLHLYGELVAGGRGQPRLDWLLLLSPLALLLGTATILLRVFPFFLSALAAVAARAPGLSGALAMWQASRNPTHVARLVLLLTLAIALGILSAGLNATLDRSEFERSRYSAGNDVRIASDRFVPLPALQSTSGVQHIAGTWRGTVTIDLQAFRTFPKFGVLALEPYSFAKATTYRADFAEDYMGELLGHLVAEDSRRTQSVTLPGRPARLGAWLRATFDDADLGTSHRYLEGDSDLDRVGFEAKLQTADGELFTVKLEHTQVGQASNTQTDPLIVAAQSGGRESESHSYTEPLDDGWRYFDSVLPTLRDSSYPLALHSIWLQNRAYRGTTNRSFVVADLHLALDDLTVIDAETAMSQVAEGFEELTRIWYLDDARSAARFTRSNPHSGAGVLALDLNFGKSLQVIGLKLTKGIKQAALPALASPTFLETTDLRVGDSASGWINSVPLDFEIVGAVRYFPTMYEDMEGGFIVTSRDVLLPLLNESSRSVTNLNEVFVLTDERISSAELAALVPNIRQVTDAETVRKTIKANPLALGLRSLTFFAYALTAVLSLIGFATHFYMSARHRETTYGVMRAMGLSPSQLYGSLLLEQVVLVLAGLALGTGLGVLLNQITLPRLPITLGDSLPIPPFVPRNDWLAVGRIYALLVLAFLTALGAATFLLWRARVHRILRIGQE